MTRWLQAFLLAMLAQAPEAIHAPPAALELAPFYKKYVDAGGLPVVSSEKVPDQALLEAKAIIVQMIAKRPDAVKSMIELKTRVAIMAQSEVTIDVPEHSDLYTAFPGTDWNKRCRGVGATRARPVCSAAEENVLQYEKDRYRGESILIHEFGHTLYSMGIAPVDPKFAERLEAAYQSALAHGLFANTYAATNVDEYWAEGVQDWFDANLESAPANGIHNEINTRRELERYDPALAKLLAEVFGDDEWRWTARKS
jgi:hypothetical protein